MGEEKEKESVLVEILMKKGYDLESARKCVNDVLDARKEAREFYLKSYVGKRVCAEFEGLQFEVMVHDIKMDYEGKPQFQVFPLNGTKKMAWVKRIINI